MESSLLVFISSVIDELEEERKTVRHAVETIPLARTWLFEDTSASSDSVEESYLAKVRECDIFISIIGKTLTDPVKREYQTARGCTKARLVFLRDVDRTLDARAFVKDITVKWAKFGTLDELHRSVQEAMTDELIKGYRRYRLNAAEVNKLAESVVVPDARAALAALRREIPDGTTALDRLSRALQEVFEQMETLQEWKELHHLLQTHRIALRLFLSEVESAYYGVTLWRAEKSKRWWSPCRQHLGELRLFAAGAQRIAIQPYYEDEQSVKGDSWVVEPVRIEYDIKRLLDGDDMNSLYDKAQLLCESYEKHLRFADRQLRIVARKVSAMLGGILRSISQ